jgi:hypothetical protein
MAERRFVKLSFEGGSDSALDLRKVPNGMGAVVRNWQPGVDGALHARNGWRVQSTTGDEPTDILTGGFSTPLDPVGFYVFERDTSRLYRNSSAITPFGTWTIVDDLASGGGGSQVVPIVAGAGYVVYGNLTFPLQRLRKFDGTVASDAGSAAVAGGGLAYWKNRFWSVGTIANGNRLRYSGIDNPDDWDLNRYIEIPGGQGEALEPFGDGLLVGTRHGVWFVTGDGPSSFALHLIDRGACTGGHAMLATPNGALMAGESRIWLWPGSGPAVPFEAVVTNIETGVGYADSVYTTMAYFDGRAYVCVKDLGSDDNLWVWEPNRNIWSTEDYVQGSDEELHQIFTAGKNLAGLTEDAGSIGPGAAGPVVYRRALDLDYGSRDMLVNETFTAKTGALQLGETASPATLMHLHLLLRQRNGDSGDVPMSITPVIDGTTPLNAAKSVSPRSPVGSFRERIDFNSDNVGFFTQLVFSHPLTTSDEATFDILEAVLEYEVEAPR